METSARLRASVDVAVIGGGAAGLYCGIEAARRGRRTIVLDHAAKPAEKIRISGGGRCNFTNLDVRPAAFISGNPHFAKSALARHTQWDFMDRLTAHGLTWHEKTLGQLFCDQRSGAIIDMLLTDLSQAGGTLHLQTGVGLVERTADGGFRLQTTSGEVICESLVVATGGLSIPKIGATGWGYDTARRFGHEIITTRAGLVPLTFSGALKEDFTALAGVSSAAQVKTADGTAFTEGLLFTHKGLSGPAILQASSYWHAGGDIEVCLSPGDDMLALLEDARRKNGQRTLFAFVQERFAKRLADWLCRDLPSGKRLADLTRGDIDRVTARLTALHLTPAGTEGYAKAEVTLGGVDTAGLSSQTMESRKVPGLYFIGEVVDVTGWLGGYNFQWAWSSGWAAGQVV